MAELAAGFVGPALEVVKWVSAPILRQFNYLCCFTTNITSLKNEAKKLQDTEQDLQGKVDAAKNDVRVICREVETWLEKSKHLKDEMDGILNEVPNVESGCFKLGARFSLSKRAKKKTDCLKELRDQCKFDADAISQPRPPAATEVVPLERTYQFESRKQIEEDIMATLRGEDVNMMGICGMGGLGKTTMARRIMNRALEEQVFEEVVMAVVSQPIDKLIIQLEIGGSLGLKLEGETSQGRVQKLHTRLSGTKRILLVLDDVWEELVPEDLGIPSSYKGCTIVLTSRNRNVLNGMNVQKIFGMKVLSEEDSRFLFKERVGTCVDDTKLNSIAKEIVIECAGLPIALTTVGAALKDEVDASIWEDALRQLRQSDPDIPELISNVYNPLKLSYDALGSKHKSVFLLCCLYPEDADIPLECLTYFCMGLRMFEGGIGNVDEARNRMRAFTKVLKSRCLLLDSKDGDDHVRMHDVVRDVCIFIAKQEGYIGDNNGRWISSIHRSELPMGLTVPNLRLLFFRAHKYSEGEFTLHNNFLEGIRDLSVVCIERYSSVSLPHATQMLRNLNTLILDHCPTVETLSGVGELVNLEILICRGCHWIEELPQGIKGLNRLKVLDLTRCGRLQRIGRGIVSSLIKLEELKMLGSFKKWEGEDREERENAGVRELEALTKLRWLEIEIQDPALAAQNIRLSSKLDRFTVKFVCEEHQHSNFDEYLSKKKMRLNWEGAAGLGDWIERQLLRDTECLYLCGNGANNVEFTKIEKMKMLELGKCESMKNVCATVLPSIDHLLLFKLPKLDRVSLNCFPNVKVIKLYDLPALKQLWKSSQSELGKDFLPQLEVLEIWRCEMMEGVFIWKGEDGNEINTCHPITIMFPKLKELKLLNLPNLISLCQGIEGIEFPLLRKMIIRECVKMKGMVANGVTSNENNSADTHCHLFCESQQGATCLGDWIEMRLLRDTECLYLSGNGANNVDLIKLENIKMLVLDKCVSLKNVVTTSMDHGVSLNCFQNLKELSLTGLPALKQLWKSSSPNELGKEFLPQLEVLDIWNCEMMEGVFMWKGEDGNENNTCHPITIMFPKLKKLQLYGLPNLISLCQGIEGIEFPLLSTMAITECGKMKGMVANGVTSNENNSAHTHCHLFCESQQVSFGCLKKLLTYGNPFCSHTIHVSLFNGLEKLEISYCRGSLSLFTSSIARNLVNLQELSISSCDEMVEVIKDDDEEKAMSATALLFPKLHTLQLSDLPKLVSFCGWKCDVELPSLRTVVIHRCPNMKNLTLGFVAGPNLESLKTDLNNYLLQLPFNTPKKLSVHGIENPLNCYEIHGSVFDRLEELIIYRYKGSMRLFSCSITGSLVNLTTLRIEECYWMVKVMEEKEEEKEKVVSAAAQTTLLFPKLHKLKLRYLPELVSFCEWKCDVELPSLSELDICECHNMKSFTSGLLTTPNLKSVEIEGVDFGGVKVDVNECLQQCHSNRIEKIQDEEAYKKKKGGEEEQESRAEIEDEQN